MDNPVGKLIDRVGAAFGDKKEGDVGDVVVRDPLGCALCDLARHYGRPIALEAMVSGLPLDAGRLPKEHVGLAGERAGLKAELNDGDPSKLDAARLPVAVLSPDGAVEILWWLNRDGKKDDWTACMSSPGQSDMRIEVPVSDLEDMGCRQVIDVVPLSGLDERGRNAIGATSGNWFFAAFRESRWIYSQTIAATVAINLLALAVPLFSMNVYDRVLPNAAEATLWALAIGVCLAIVFDFLIRTLRAHFIDAAGRRADVRLANFIYSRLLSARLGPQPASAGVRSNTLREFETLREFFNSATVTVFGDLPFLLLFVGVIWIIAGPLALIVAIAIPIVLGVGWITQRALQKRVEAAFRETAQKNAVVVETLVGLEDVKAAGAESWAARKWEGAVAEHVRTGLSIKRLSNFGLHIVQALQTAVQVFVVVIGFYMVVASQLTMGALIATTILTGRALAPLAQAAALLARIHQARIAYRALTEIVSAPQERGEGVSKYAPPSVSGRVTFENVSFSYDEDSEPALRELNFDIEAGERVALIGGIGSGKTTALKLVQGLYTPTLGRVLVDGVSAGQYEPAVLRAHVGLTLQDATLFHGSIRDNITISDPAAREAEILEATKAAGALNWIAHTAHGFNAPVRERGAGLSGGQRQSVVLARAILKRPTVMLLDEPTSEMDGRTEAAVILRLKKFFHGSTLVVVTHRPAVLELVDRIIVLERGAIVKDGPKAQVLKELRAMNKKRAAPGRKARATATVKAPA